MIHPMLCWIDPSLDFLFTLDLHGNLCNDLVPSNSFGRNLQGVVTPSADGILAESMKECDPICLIKIKMMKMEKWKLRKFMIKQWCEHIFSIWWNVFDYPHFFLQRRTPASLGATSGSPFSHCLPTVCLQPHSA